MRNKPKMKFKKRLNLFFSDIFISWGPYLLAMLRNYASVLVFLNKFCRDKEIFHIHKRLRVNKKLRVKLIQFKFSGGLYFH